MNLRTLARPTSSLPTAQLAVGLDRSCVAAAAVLSHAVMREAATLASLVITPEVTVSGESTFFCVQRGTPARSSRCAAQAWSGKYPMPTGMMGVPSE